MWMYLFVCVCVWVIRSKIIQISIRNWELHEWAWCAPSAESVFNTDKIIVIPIGASPSCWYRRNKYHDVLGVWNRWNCWLARSLALTSDCVSPTPNSVRTQSTNLTRSSCSDLCIPSLSLRIQSGIWTVRSFRPAIFRATSISHCAIVPLSAILFSKRIIGCITGLLRSQQITMTELTQEICDLLVQFECKQWLS